MITRSLPVFVAGFSEKFFKTNRQMWNVDYKYMVIFLFLPTSNVTTSVPCTKGGGRRFGMEEGQNHRRSGGRESPSDVQSRSPDRGAEEFLK